jgi:hypothetical protein
MIDASLASGSSLARSFDALVDAIGDGFAHLTPVGAHACFRHCGYEVTQPL